MTAPFLRAALLSLVTIAHAAQGASPPNIVFILADDLGWHQLGCYGSTFYETPNIDRLSEQGTRFTNAYAACPVCSPTRASIMTGKNPARLHLTNYIPGRNRFDRKLLSPDWTAHLPLKEVTIAESLKNRGYTTGHFGKWHLNYDKHYKPNRPGDPGSQGFDEVLTTRKPSFERIEQPEEDWHNVSRITARAIQFIEENKSSPFFCYVTHNSIHDPEVEQKSLVEKYRAKSSSKITGNNPTQAAMLETLDRSVGTIIDKLAELGIEENTLVIFYSDNGHLGPKNGKPFRGSKGDLYEGGVRMPLVVKWPRTVPSGKVCEEIVISHDFFPTFCELAGQPATTGDPATPGDIDGVSLVPLLQDAQARLDRDTIYWHFPHYHSAGLGPQGALRKGRYKLIEWFEKSIDGEPGARELYDLIDDPGEARNLVNKLPKVTAQLTQDLESWRKRVGAQPMTLREP